MTLLARYIEGIRSEFRYFPAWPPNAPYKIGDVGEVVDGEFRFLTTLAALGIPFTTRSGTAGNDMSHTSHESVTVQFKAAGQTLPGAALPEAKAGFQIKFESAGAFIFQAAAPTVHQISDQYALSKDILTRFATWSGGKRLWDPDWFVVNEVVTAQRLTVMISDSTSATIDISVEGNVPVGPIPLAGAGVGLKIERQSGQVTTFLADTGLTPLIGLKRVKRGLLAYLFQRDDWAEVIQSAGPGQAPGLPADVLELADLADWETVKDGSGRPTRHMRPRPQQPQPEPNHNPVPNPGTPDEPESLTTED
ncbi:MAG: hypothetical protein JSS49_16405 [Planctomycetes bacterium]|nr:hypothetical protein [Planctomycetota bacterium]